MYMYVSRPLLASFPDPSPVSIACSTLTVLQGTEAGLGPGNKAKATPQLQDKIWEWPGNEATVVAQTRSLSLIPSDVVSCSPRQESGYVRLPVT